MVVWFKTHCKVGSQLKTEITIYVSTLRMKNQKLLVKDTKGRCMEIMTRRGCVNFVGILYRQYFNCNRFVLINCFTRVKAIAYALAILSSHPIFFLLSSFRAKKITMNISEEELNLPIEISLQNENRRFWVSREAARKGVAVESLASSLEINLTNLKDYFGGYVWDIDLQPTGDLSHYFILNNLKLNIVTPDALANYESLHEDVVSGVNFGMVKVKNGSVVHGRFAITANNFHPLSSHQLLQTRYVVAESIISPNKLEANLIAPIKNNLSLESAIFVGTHSNYFHFIYECVTRLIYLRRMHGCPKNIIVSDELPRTLIEFLQQFFDLEVIVCPYYAQITVNELWLGTTEESLGFMKIDGRRNAFDLIRKQVNGSISGSNSEVRSRSIFVRRPFKSSRPLQNRMMLTLMAKLHGFTIVSPEKLEIAEQVLLFQNAFRIIGEEGAALTNLLFIPKSASVLELQEPVMHSKNLFRDFSDLPPAQYRVLFGIPSKFGESGFSRDGFFVNPFKVYRWIRNTRNPHF
jgi:hypothetical protein